MDIQEVRTITKSHSIHPGKQSKTELIKSIQLGEGNFDCFATALAGECDQSGCSWRKDCFEASRQGALS